MAILASSATAKEMAGMTKIIDRFFDAGIADQLVGEGLNPTMARIYAARGVSSQVQLQTTFSNLIPPSKLQNVEMMAALLCDAIEQNKRLLIVADYDSDGATACALGVKALKSLGATVDYLVPNRFEHGYGLTPEIVQLALDKQPDCIITVDNGIASVEGVAEARRLGIPVFITDHHLPGDTLPDAACIVNPNAPGCAFPSKHLAGVGVMFYVMLALRAEMRQRGHFKHKDEPNLSDLLDLVALGTVADVVRLDENNRLLVDQGLRRIRAGRAAPGLVALLKVAGRNPSRAGTYDLGFSVGPRLNAAGRLEDMGLGIACLLAEDDITAMKLAMRLDEINKSRRDIESDMQQTAVTLLEKLTPEAGFSLSLFDDSWHQGVIGILASRLKEKYHRPVIVFAPSGSGGEPQKIKGSGRSIVGLHLRDALDIVSKRYPDLLLSFGGHAMAAGLSLYAYHFDIFNQAFEQVCAEMLTEADLQQIIETDGVLSSQDHQWALAEQLEAGIWGQGFPIPSFHADFTVKSQRIVGGRHLKLQLALEGVVLDGMLYFQETLLPEQIHAVYQLGTNEFNGQKLIQITVRHWFPATLSESFFPKRLA